MKSGFPPPQVGVEVEYHELASSELGLENLCALL